MEETEIDKQIQDDITELSEKDPEKQLGDLALDFTGGLIATDDDVNTPAFTIRAVLIATVFSIPLTFINTVASFRNNAFGIPSTIANILAYPIGIFFAATLPNVSLFGMQLNPGPFSVKEHVLINTIVSASAASPYGIDNVVGQYLFFNDRDVNFWNSFVFVALTQFLGYGLAGLGRRFFVKPTAMLWPSVLGQVGFFNSFHGAKSLDSPDSKYTAFWLAFSFMFIYQWIPSYFATTLTSVSLLCFLSKNRVVRFLGSSYVDTGPGILSFSFDWTYIGGAYSPMYVNWNSMFGNVLGMWVIAPLAYYMGAFGTPTLQPEMNYGGGYINSFTDWKNSTISYDPLPPYSSNSLYDVNGYQLSLDSGGGWPSLLDENNNLNQTAFDIAGDKIYLSTGFAFSYLASFLEFGAMFSQTFLFYGKDIYRQMKEAANQTENDLDSKDPHYKIMKNYKDVGEPYYLVYFAVLTIATILFLQWSVFTLPWYGSILAILISILGAIPTGALAGITGNTPGLNIISEMIGGFMFTGKPVYVMTFKSLGTNVVGQTITLLGDLKLGHYMHISPIAMIASQFIGTLYGAIINTSASFYAMNNIVNITDPQTQYGAQGYLVFASAGGIWGALGPARAWGASSPYFVLNYGYLIGFLLPFIPFLMNKVYPAKFWNYVNFYIICDAMGPYTGTINSGYINVIIVSIFVQFYLYRYKRDFWDKYVYSIQIAFDTAAPLVTTIGVLLQTYVITDSGSSQQGLFTPSTGVYDYYCYGQTWDGSASSF
ncbi:hypothetical protein HDV01_000459 [Terramyces sp. JEL0728]|nr:hypothetical protein HDV01_000459 [Terramyces sp. JEL0728]